MGTARQSPSQCVCAFVSVTRKFWCLREREKSPCNACAGPVEMFLRAVVRIVGDDIEGLGDLDLVDVELHHGAVVLGHELVRAPVICGRAQPDRRESR